jgi:hypothetical protein
MLIRRNGGPIRRHPRALLLALRAVLAKASEGGAS